MATEISWLKQEHKPSSPNYEHELGVRVLQYILLAINTAIERNYEAKIIKIHPKYYHALLTVLNAMTTYDGLFIKGVAVKIDTDVDGIEVLLENE